MILFKFFLSLPMKPHLQHTIYKESNINCNNNLIYRRKSTETFSMYNILIDIFFTVKAEDQGYNRHTWNAHMKHTHACTHTCTHGLKWAHEIKSVWCMEHVDGSSEC